MYALFRFVARVKGWMWRKLLSAPLTKLYSAPGLRIGPGTVFYGLPVLDLKPGGSIKVGARAVLCSTSQFTALGVSHPVVIRAMTSKANITLGDDCGLSGTTICAVDRITIGSGVLMGADVQISDNDFHPLTSAHRRYEEEGIVSKPVLIEDNVFIGSRTTVLKGVTIGKNSVIGAGSVVTKDIPPNTIAAGNPCRPIRDITELAS